MNKKLTGIFMGTPEFAVPSLQALAKVLDLKLVITQPDRPSGRRLKVVPPAVKTAALDLGIEVIAPNIVKGKRFASKILQYKPDIIVTAAFGRILGASLLCVPNIACLNVHASILPKYRGAAPINQAILNGDTEAGVSIIKMVEELDAGDIYKCSKIKIDPDETAGELTSRLSILGATTLIEVLSTIEKSVLTPQNNKLSSHVNMIKKADGKIDWSKNAMQLHNHVRGMHPWPTATAMWNNAPFKIHKTKILSEKLHTKHCNENPGTVIKHSEAGIDVTCGEGILRLIEIQLPGKRRLEAKQFFSGVKFKPGIIL